MIMDNVVRKKFNLEAVYVIENNDGEELVYHSELMKEGKKYPIIWNGEKFVLVKTDGKISLYKFYPEK